MSAQAAATVTARIKGAEQEIEWAPIAGLNISLGATELDPKMSEPFCHDVDPATGQQRAVHCKVHRAFFCPQSGRCAAAGR
jgi:hypothetical protein